MHRSVRLREHSSVLTPSNLSSWMFSTFECWKNTTSCISVTSSPLLQLGLSLWVKKTGSWSNVKGLKRTLTGTKIDDVIKSANRKTIKWKRKTSHKLLLHSSLIKSKLVLKLVEINRLYVCCYCCKSVSKGAINPHKRANKSDYCKQRRKPPDDKQS